MTREEAIERIKQNKVAAEYYGGVTYIEDIEAFDMAIEALKAQEWIPCSERPPEEIGFYFVTEQNFGRCKEAEWHEVVSHTSYYYGDGKWDDRFYLDDVSNITAWIPLPKPYKEGE